MRRSNPIHGMGCIALGWVGLLVSACVTADPKPTSILPETLTRISPTPTHVTAPNRGPSIAESIRRFQLGSMPSAPPDAPAVVSGPASDPTALWLEYLRIAQVPSPKAREKALKGLLARPISDSLRHVVLRDMASDLSYQSRRAQFIRRYGFYANWFNRLAYTASRAIQGNIQAVGQLFVDAVFDAVGRGESTPAERRLFKLLRDLEAEGRSTIQDRKKIERLERKIHKARANMDVERGRFALGQGDPDRARFYALGALGFWPDNKKAKRLLLDAAREDASRVRATQAVLQVGYPDRQPPVEMSSTSLLRAVLSQRRGELNALIRRRAGDAAPRASALPDLQGESADLFLDEGDYYLAVLMTTQTDQDAGGIMAMRQWAQTLNDIDAQFRGKTLWMRDLLLDPRFNPDLRLARAQASRRGSMTRFIFVGPESSRERTYKASSRAAQMWNALSGIGIFYGFEVIYRALVAAFSPPPPADEMLDAAAAFLRADRLHPDSRSLAVWLAEQYKKSGRFDQARDLLADFGQLDLAASYELNLAEARRLIAQAELQPAGRAERDRLLDRAIGLAPGTRLAARARRLVEASPRIEPIVLEAEWETLRQWTGQAPPAGLPPNRPEWFDGDPTNGEAEGTTFRIEAASAHPSTVRVIYPVLIGGARQILDEQFDMAAAPEALAAWVRHALAGQSRIQAELGRLGRPRIPYEFQGGAGLSGVDFYPKLQPIETDPNETKLYQN